jgi:hypothetical protein
MQMKNLLLILMYITVLILNGACSFESLEPPIDKGKFANLDAASRAIKESINAGEKYSEVADRAEKLSAEIVSAQQIIKTKKEKRLLKAYSDLLGIYRDGLLLWKYQAEFPFLASELKGEIYVGQEVEPIVQKYQFKVESHVYKPTGQKWKSIPADSIRMIWKSADNQLDIIHKMTNYSF